MSRNERIAKLEEEMKTLNAKSYTTSNSHFGTGLKPKQESATYHTQMFMAKAVNPITKK